MIEFKCSDCGKNLRVGENAAGKRGKCPECGATLLVPQAEIVALEAAEPSSTPPPIAAGDVQTVTPQPPSSSERRKHRLWIALLVLAALIASPFAPKFPLWFGVILLLLCVLVFIPSVQNLSRRLLRINPNEKWRGGLRLTMYGLIGLVLILASWAGSGYKADQDRIAAKQAAEEAEQQRLTTEANSQVVALVAEAEEVWKQGNSTLAEEKLRAASNTPNATNLSLAQQLRTRMANKKVEGLVTEVINALKDGDIDSARERIKAALAVPHADALTAAKTLDQQISNATDSTRIYTALMEMPDEAFQRLKEDGTMPTHLLSGYDGLDRRISELAMAQIEQVAAAREERRMVQLEAERKRKEAERLTAEAARKAEEERQAQEKARREAAQKEAKDRLDAYLAVLNAAEVKLIKSVSVRRIDNDTWEATLTVDNLWHIRHYQIRLQDAQTLWEAWAIIASPKEPDKARIKLVDLRENEVGGSRVWGGSLIWVKKD